MHLFLGDSVLDGSPPHSNSLDAYTLAAVIAVESAIAVRTPGVGTEAAVLSGCLPPLTVLASLRCTCIEKAFPRSLTKVRLDRGSSPRLPAEIRAESATAEVPSLHSECPSSLYSSRAAQARHAE